MSIESNKAVVRRFIEQVLNNMDTALVDEIFAPDYANHLVPGGREGFKQFVTMMRSAYPDFTGIVDIKHMVAEGDTVMMRATAHYSNGGKEATGEGWGEYRVVNGKIVEDWPLSGAFELLSQVGITLPG
jgi:predicted SnoaL-like aldol condensation-catalyzing enzyme